MADWRDALAEALLNKGMAGSSAAPPRALSPLYDALAPDPNANYGTLLPVARDKTTGERRFAMPEMVRSGAKGMLDLMAGTETGNVTPEAVQSLIFGGLTGGLATPKGAFGVFGGPGARTADKNALYRAIDNEVAGGKAAASNFAETGWFRGPDSKWRFEINDLAANYKPTPIKFEGKLADVLDHPELYAAYPELKNVNFVANPRLAWGGAREPDKLSVKGIFARDPELGKSLLLHEVQHELQSIENFALGGAPNAELAKRLPPNWQKNAMSKDPAIEARNRIAGEVEADNVQMRLKLGLTPEQSRAWFPRDTANYPYDQQFVRQVSPSDPTAFFLREGRATPAPVMFPGTEDAIQILRKYGMATPVPLAAPAASPTDEQRRSIFDKVY